MRSLGPATRRWATVLAAVAFLASAGSGSASAQEALRYDYAYPCNQEHIIVGHCRRDSDEPGYPPTTDAENFCQVYYPDRPKNYIGGTAFGIELRADLEKQLRACGAFAAAAAQASPAGAAQATPSAPAAATPATAAASGTGKVATPGGAPPDEAMAYNQQAMQLHTQARQSFEQKNYKQGNDQKTQAAALYRKAIAADPRRWEPYYNLGDLLEANTSGAGYLEAAEQFEKALALRPDDASLWNRLGNAYWNAGGKTAEAIAAEDRATRLDPKNAQYVYNLGFMHADIGEFDRARQLSTRLQSLDAQRAQKLLDKIRSASGESSLAGRPKNYGNPRIELVRIEAGSSTVGNHASVSAAYYLGKFPVTQAQWQMVMGDNPSFFKDCGGNCPVEQVSWNDAQAFITRLNQLHDGYRYRLPSDAEWELAFLAGGKDAPTLGGDFGWSSGNSGDRTHPVGEKKANAFGLHDMNGHLQEWCADVSGTNRMFHVLRGMNFHTTYMLILTNRSSGHAEERSRNNGFRVAADKARP